MFHLKGIEYYQKSYYSREKNVIQVVVDPLFRNPKRYKNKERIAQIYREYKNMSLPISIETYKKGLKSIATYLDLDVDREIEESIRVASIIYDETATNCFSRNVAIRK